MKKIYLITLILIFLAGSLIADSLSTSGITGGSAIETSHITNLYDILMGNTTFSNVNYRNIQKFRCSIIQDSTGIGSVRIYENSLNDTVEFSGASGTITGAVDVASFTENKTFINTSGVIRSDLGAPFVAQYPFMTYGYRDSANIIYIRIYDIINDSYSNAINNNTKRRLFIEILVYP